jgi:hypothetical protein
LESPPLQDEPDEGTGVSPRVATTAQSQVVENFGGLALGAKSKRRDKMAISRGDVRAEPLLDDQRSGIGTDFPATFPSEVGDGRLKVESGPSWLATSSAMNSNPASVGSGGCSHRDEAGLIISKRYLLVDPRSVDARVVAIERLVGLPALDTD